MAISFSAYDSGDFATVEESVAHSKNNPFIISNMSNKLIAVRNNELVTMVEPNSPLINFLFMLDEFVITTKFIENERFMPERTSKRLYGSHDFWYVCMLLNNCFTIKNYEFKDKFRILPSDSLYRIEKFQRLNKKTSRMINDSDESLYIK